MRIQNSCINFVRWRKDDRLESLFNCIVCCTLSVYIVHVYTNGDGTSEKGTDIEAALDLIQQSYALQRELVGSI